MGYFKTNACGASILTTLNLRLFCEKNQQFCTIDRLAAKIAAGSVTAGGAEADQYTLTGSFLGNRISAALMTAGLVKSSRA